MRFSKLALSVLLTFAPAAQASAQTADRQLAGDIDAFITRLMALNVTPGLAVAVVKGSEPVLIKGYGFADVERKQPVTPTTGFYIASVTKTFTALAMKLLDERGTLKLGEPVSRYLPQLQLAPGLAPDSITLQQLITHTHGIENAGPVVARTAFSGEHTNQQLLQLLREHKASTSGRNYRYTNVGFNLAGLVIDEVTRSSWKTVLETEIFRPLGMKHTTAYVSKYDSARLAMPYTATRDGSFRRLHYAKGDRNMHAAGGLVSTARDMAKWLEVQMNGGVLDGQRIFPAHVIAATQSKVVPVPLPASNRPDPQIGQGLGWQIFRFSGEEVLLHGGGFSAFVTLVAIVPAHKIGVAVMVNEAKTGGGAGDFIAEYVIERALNQSGHAEKYAEGMKNFEINVARRRTAIAEDAARREARPQTLPHPLTAYVGTYENPLTGTIVWEQHGDRLHARWGLLQSIAEVFDHTSNKLRVELEPGSGEVIEFKMTDGRAASLVYGGREYVRVK